ncbi:60S ribosomal protein L18a [Araneus ventricosus]|uniref:60S ribosomal protein L18a n=2 Tax=Araneus ventricosus TaxID=182803 RepID=A0A4Y2X5Z4_ARAVE|nr:60S ribosomal protein L18a [Araneus ventricosus]GBO44581.1 60S ribosomal protein L18a [Araneus ventricosus]
MKVKGELKEYKIIGRPLVTDKLKTPPLYRMRIFAPDKVTAKSRFWYFTRKLKKLKKSNGEIVSISEVSFQCPAPI